MRRNEKTHADRRESRHVLRQVLGRLSGKVLGNYGIERRLGQRMQKERDGEER